MRKELLVEIGVEELPAIPFLKELPNIKSKWLRVLEKNSLSADFEFYYTPRRLVFISKNFLLKQADSEENLFGPPVDIAYKDGKPTNAALGFAKKCGVKLNDIQISNKGDRKVLLYKKRLDSKNSEELLPDMIEEFLLSLNFGKSMRWGSFQKSFIRPIRWVGILLDNKEIRAKLFNVDTSCKTYLHRSLGYQQKEYNSIDNYLSILKAGGIVLDPKEREKIILDEFKKLEEKNNFSIDIDKQLLDEVIAITEYPTPLLGKFDAKFLKLPKEVIMASMKEHQRYFPIFRDEELLNNFIVVANAKCDDYSKIVKGNEKVLYPRLSDALFFYENDLKNPPKNEQLKSVAFMKDLGSMYDKVIREEKIAQYLLKDESQRDELKRAVLNAKNDLLTDMVYEFTELQGIMGYYYAKEMNEDSKIALSYKEQYLPDGEDSKLPSNDFSAIVALANKLDTILALFSKNRIPTGTKDPYGLRRAAVGVVKIVIDRKFSFDLNRDLKELSKNYDDIDISLIEDFFLERISRYFNANQSVIKAVFKSKERDIYKLFQKVEALNSIVIEDDFKEDFSTFKRVANIIKDIDIDSSELIVDSSLFEDESEKVLYDSFNKIEKSVYKSYKDRLNALFGLKNDIDNFFAQVLVNSEDLKIQKNRKNLIALIYKSFMNVADIKEISI